nr:MAG TPA: hypothetical protein [Caudoviricetes sp.]
MKGGDYLDRQGNCYETNGSISGPSEPPDG